jgi:hypothetical protein
MAFNRRGFFSTLGGLFSGRKHDEIFFYGLQVVINVYGEDTLRQSLHRVITSGEVEERPEAKRSFYKRIASLLLENQPFIEYGYWDYLLDAQDAQTEFENWVNEIEGSMATEEEELGETVDEGLRMSSDKSYVIVTLAFVLESVAAHENLRETLDGIPEEKYFDKETFTTLIEAVNYIDFEYSYADAAFVMPGNDKDGISFEDIHGEGWEYLKPIMGSM